MARLFFQGFLLLVASVVPAMASDVEGRVSARHGRVPFSGAKAQLIRENRVVDECLVATDGRFEFHNVPVGAATVRIHAEGYRDEDVPLFIQRSNSRENVSVELRPLEEDVPPTETVSVTKYQIP